MPVSASVSIERICLSAVAGVFGSLLAPGGEAALKTLGNADQVPRGPRIPALGGLRR